MAGGLLLPVLSDSKNNEEHGHHNNWGSESVGEKGCCPASNQSESSDTELRGFPAGG